MSRSDRPERVFESEDAMHIVHALEEQTEMSREQFATRLEFEEELKSARAAEREALEAEFAAGRRFALVAAILTGMHARGDVDLDAAIRQADYLMERM